MSTRKEIVQAAMDAYDRITAPAIVSEGYPLVRRYLRVARSEGWAAMLGAVLYLVQEAQKDAGTDVDLVRHRARLVADDELASRSASAAFARVGRGRFVIEKLNENKVIAKILAAAEATGKEADWRVHGETSLCLACGHGEHEGRPCFHTASQCECGRT